MKKILRQSRNREHLLELSFNAEEIQKIHWEDENEFRWQGEMYDVVSKKMQGDRLVITCISDKEEERLLAHYLATTEQNQKKSKNSLAKFVTDNFVNSESLQLQTCCFVLKKIFFESATTLLSRCSAIITPPPKVC